jgi:hypothetical protein
MFRLRPLLIVCALILISQGMRGAVPESDIRSPETVLPVGRWRVEFSNGVNEECVVGNGGTAVVDEPRRRSRGRVEARGSSFLMTFHDDRVERWTAVGGRFVVEHWFPGSQFPAGRPVLGIAEANPASQ